jgi:hypothetical protein
MFGDKHKSKEIRIEQEQFQEFTNLLVELQVRKKISGEQSRQIRKLWEDSQIIENL